MNLNNIVSPIVAAVSDWVSVSIQPSQGYGTNPDGSRVAKYGLPISMFAQIQPLLYRDLIQIEGLNLNGEKRAMYANGDYQAVVRSSKEGGDLVTLQDGSVWLVVQQLENWSMENGWVKCAIVKQNGS